MRNAPEPARAKSTPSGDAGFEIGEKDDTGGRNRPPRIRCPKCRWQPQRDSLWMCVCLHTWNTFDTRGLCPGCGLQWQDTCCLKCLQWSKHREWYADDERRG